MKRFEVMNQVLSGFLTLKQAQEILGLSYRQVFKAKGEVQVSGF
ncbi:hypothetical protein [Thermodesulfovibrio hydrogeniphilus]